MGVRRQAEALNASSARRPSRHKRIAHPRRPAAEQRPERGERRRGAAAARLHISTTIDVALRCALPWQGTLGPRAPSPHRPMGRMKVGDDRSRSPAEYFLFFLSRV
eukprot:4158487-Prymnesium_polylepis.2